MCVYNLSDNSKHARLILTYRMSAHMSDYLYMHPYVYMHACMCVKMGRVT
eukprot:COSAG05_NODE_825_length_7106_cov_74.690881_12_plen_50_part_00